MSDEAKERLGGLPAEIRDADFALIARTTVAGVSQALVDAQESFDAGYVSVTLPNGATVGTPIKLVGAGSALSEDICQMLEALPAVSAFLTTAEVPFSAGCVSPVTESYDAGTDTPGGNGFPIGMHFRLTPGSGKCRDDAKGADLSTNEPIVRIVHPAAAASATVSLWARDTVPLSIVVAPGTTVELSPTPPPLGVALTTGIPIVDDLMRLRDVGRITDVAAILNGIAPEDMLRHLDEHPAASAIIGYGFLRTEDPERILQLFREMATLRPDFADTAVLAGEACARMGRHEDAVGYFVKATEVGLPAFSFGMNYLIDRLRHYDPQTGGTISDAELTKQVQRALGRVQVYAPVMLHGAVPTSYMLAE